MTQSETGESFRQKWTTAAVRQADRFSYFREGVCQTFCAYSPEPPQDRKTFKARLETATTDQCSIAEMETSPFRVVHAASDLAKITGDPFVLSLGLRGAVEGVVAGQSFSLGVNQVGLLHSSAVSHFALDQTKRYHSIGLIFDRPAFSGVSLEPISYFNQPGDLVVRDCLKLIADGIGDCSREKLSYLVDAALALAKASLIRSPDYLLEEVTQNSGVRKGLYIAIKKFVTQKASDPGLSAKKVAATFGVTPRYVQMLFAEQNTTFHSFVTRLRLEQVRKELLAEHAVDVSVREAAYRCGFRDMTTFHRNFRQFFGDTPLQIKQRKHMPEV